MIFLFRIHLFVGNNYFWPILSFLLTNFYELRGRHLVLEMRIYCRPETPSPCPRRQTFLFHALLILISPFPFGQSIGLKPVTRVTISSPQIFKRYARGEPLTLTPGTHRSTEPSQKVTSFPRGNPLN